MLPLLTGLRVTELANSISAAYAGRLLADLGAEVTAVDRGDDFLADVSATPRIADFLRVNKRTMLASDEQLAEPAVIDDLFTGSDIVLYDGSLDSWNRLLIQQDGYRRYDAVLCVTTAFGLQSPYAALHDDELLYFALSGIASATPEGATDQDTGRPMQFHGRQAAFVAGATAAFAALQGWLGLRNGQASLLIDIAIADTLVAMPVLSQAPAFSGAGNQGRASSITTPNGFLECADGFVVVQGNDSVWPGWAELIGIPEWSLPPMTDPAYRLEHWDEIQSTIKGWLTKRAKIDVYKACQARGIIAFAVASIGEVTSDEQMVFREAFATIYAEDGSPAFVAPRSPIRVLNGQGPSNVADRLATATPYASGGRRVADSKPRLRERESKLPLDGVQVADLSWVIAGPRCAEWLGALGAEVFKIESKVRPDAIRANPYMFNMLNYSKRSCTINLATDDGRALARSLILNCGIVIENMTTGSMEKLGLSYDALAKDRADLVMVSCSGVGRTGPSSYMGAYGRNIHGFVGHTYLTRWSADDRLDFGGTWADPVTSIYMVVATLAALIYREQTGNGCHIDLSLAESTIAVMSDTYLDYFVTGSDPIPLGNRDRRSAVHNTYKCRDNKWIAIAAHGESEWSALCALASLSLPSNALGESSSAGDVDADLDRWCSLRPSTELLRDLSEHNICAVPVLEFAESTEDPHYSERQIFRVLTVDDTRYTVTGLPWLERPRSSFQYRGSPNMGLDNEYVFRDVLGLSESEIARLGTINALT